MKTYYRVDAKEKAGDKWTACFAGIIINTLVIGEMPNDITKYTKAETARKAVRKAIIYDEKGNIEIRQYYRYRIVKVTEQILK